MVSRYHCNHQLKYFVFLITSKHYNNWLLCKTKWDEGRWILEYLLNFNSVNWQCSLANNRKFRGRKAQQCGLPVSLIVCPFYCLPVCFIFSPLYPMSEETSVQCFSYNNSNRAKVVEGRLLSLRCNRYKPDDVLTIYSQTYIMWTRSIKGITCWESLTTSFHNLGIGNRIFRSFGPKFYHFSEKYKYHFVAYCT